MLHSLLYKLYITKKLSVAQISRALKCSQNKINYWLSVYGIKKRTIAEALYLHHNPRGDPFTLRLPENINDALLFGLGLGLYWGEGSKRGAGGVRLGNTDAKLIKQFIRFLESVFCIKRSSLRFGLQIFEDISPNRALHYWIREIKVSRKQFYRITVSKVRGAGTYKYKSEYGVLSVYFNNVKLKALICEMIDKLQ